ncbi:hypothetical protein MBANPS3_010571 [Mucor bainieri]
MKLRDRTKRVIKKIKQEYSKPHLIKATDTSTVDLTIKQEVCTPVLTATELSTPTAANADTDNPTIKQEDTKKDKMLLQQDVCNEDGRPRVSVEASRVNPQR